MADHACLLAASRQDPMGGQSSAHSTMAPAYRPVRERVIRACGRTPSPWRSGRYHFGATARIAATTGLMLGSLFLLTSALTRFVWAALGL
ncbi:hypothetical protein Sp245p_26005 (plasmid) [Azospirillum baldaniorum]|uniref:Uncharacterized protein n=1 Tax=Azospirillum baldaniorum TaxID=1064539 RepID=A0A9P1JZR4_9PROT|nr:hypothetical protein Sp245p_26005 [Azospirillum baldaniorum]TWA77975.1 hypothetical protein FBZ85_106135 [Azospirillum brasilense]CCD02925.1 protein of unknown function [Azospirillum baldaniorum]